MTCGETAALILQEDVDIGMNRSTDGGQSWEPMKVIMDMGEWGGKPQNQNGIGDPAILVDRTDKYHLGSSHLGAWPPW